MSKLNSSYLKAKFKSGGVSTLGYKRNSPDVNNPYNIIPSNQITMEDVDFPVLGIDDLGNQIMMQPGEDYTFPGSYVTEFPMKNMGNKRFAQVGIEKKKKGLYKPDFRSKSQITAEQQKTNSVVNQPGINARPINLFEGQTSPGVKALDAVASVGDVITDVMQAGNFIPNPIAQGIGKLGNWLGAGIDAYQAGRSAYEGDYGDAAINVGSAVLPSIIRNPNVLGGYSRSAKYNFGNRSKYLPVDRLYGRMTPRQLAGNRALLGTLGVETAYDAGAFNNINSTGYNDINNTGYNTISGGPRDNTFLNQVTKQSSRYETPKLNPGQSNQEIQKIVKDYYDKKDLLDIYNIYKPEQLNLSYLKSTYQTGGTNKPIPTSDWSKVKNYNDSLTLYNNSKWLKDLKFDGSRTIGSGQPIYGGLETPSDVLNDPDADWNKYNTINRNIRPIAYLHEYYVNPDGNREGTTLDRRVALYEKPVQPYFYQKPDPYKGFLGRLGDVKSMGLPDIDVTPEMDMTPRTVSTPNRVYKYKHPTYKVQSNYKEPGIYEYGGPGERYYREIVTPMRPQRSIHAAKHTKNYKKEGGEISNFQEGGKKSVVLEPDYDMYKAPRQGNYLLPDINRPYYTDEFGDNRSEYKMGFNIDGKETLLPTVVGGRQLTPDEALQRYYQTGLHMGMYTTPEQAEYASRLRTAKYNMLQDPARFNASMFKQGGVIRQSRSQVNQTLKYSKQKPNKI